MKILRKLITFDLGSIGSPWSLEENELDSYINEEVLVLDGDEAKALHKKKLVMAKRIITNSIKDHLIP